MSISLWAWKPSCDKRECCGDCDDCPESEREEEQETVDEWTGRYRE